MTHALIKTWSGEKKLPLEQALKPEGKADAGTLENLASTVEAEQNSIGLLLATLVDHKVIGLDEACLIAGQTREVKIYHWPK